MRTITAETPLRYVYDPEHFKARYSLNDGESWMNHGDMCEHQAKAILGYTPHKDSVAFDKKCDIPELQASVKSYKCGLTDAKDMPDDPDEFLAEFWKRDTAKMYIYVCDHGECFTLYMLNEKEFQRMVTALMSWDRHIGNYRMYKRDSTVEAWLTANCAED